MELDLLFKESNILYNVLCFLISENEKLFDRTDSKLYWRTVLHLYVLFHHACIGLFARQMEENLKNSDEELLQSMHKFRAGYLTGWNFMFQTVFLFIALTHDVLEWVNKESTEIGRKIRYWRDVFYCSLVLPYTCFVFCMFWSLYTIDRELVYPRVYDDVVPWWFNQCVHSNIVAMLVIEALLQPRRHPTNYKLELIINISVGVLYAVVYYSIFFFANRWLYNVFGIMTWWQVCLFQLLIWLSSYIFYIIQFPINRLIHGEEKENMKNGDVKQIGENEDGRMKNKGEMMEVEKTVGLEKSWSVKYRDMRNLECSSL